MEEPSRSSEAADALVLFGVSGDLAGKMLLPALYRLAASGRNVPVIGMAHADWTPGQFVDHVRRRVAQVESRIDHSVFDRFAASLRYVSGDVRDGAAFERLRKMLGDARHPLHYLAIPPQLFVATADQLAASGCAKGARIAVEKPFGHDATSAHALEAALERIFDEASIFRVDHYLAARPVQDLLYFRFLNPAIEALWRAGSVSRVQITLDECFGVARRGRFYDAVGALQDVVQNHVIQILAMVAMDLPCTLDAEAIHAARLALLQAVEPPTSDDVVRGQYAGYREIEGVAPRSTTETFIAIRLHIDKPRWRGVPFLIRAGKCLRATSTAVVIDLESAPSPRAATSSSSREGNRLRFALGPGRAAIAFEGRARSIASDSATEPMALVAERGWADDVDAYQRLLGAALAGERTFFEREASIEAAWRIFDRLRGAMPEVLAYAPGSWGPTQSERLTDGRGWIDPPPDTHCESKS